ncbi:MAG TPA: GNAT family N-acetyltransferase [Gemmatimonadales bacterium]|nr:GNAT family N-acetyltransferase [Gemmatimonadales bacterium]
MPDRDQVEQLTSCDGPAFRELYEIYAGSIAAREQKPEAWICAMIRAPEYRFCVLQRDGHVTAFSILFLPQTEPFALLEYMAVAPRHRNHGLGSKVFKQSVKQAVRPDGRRLPVLLEVDSDREASSDQHIRTRRQQFYRRLGCLRVSGLHYILPLAGEGDPPMMDLMVYAPAQQPLAKAHLERWLRTIYRDVYHSSPDDPRIARMLDGVPDPVRLE